MCAINEKRAAIRNAILLRGPITYLGTEEFGDNPRIKWWRYEESQMSHQYKHTIQWDNFSEFRLTVQ